MKVCPRVTTERKKYTSIEFPPLSKCQYKFSPKAETWYWVRVSPLFFPEFRETDRSNQYRFVVFLCGYFISDLIQKQKKGLYCSPWQQKQYNFIYMDRFFKGWRAQRRPLPVKLGDFRFPRRCSVSRSVRPLGVRLLLSFLSPPLRFWLELNLVLSIWICPDVILVNLNFCRAIPVLNWVIALWKY